MKYWNWENFQMQPSEMFKKHSSTLFKSVEGRESNVPVDEVEEILKLVRTLLNSILYGLC